MASWASWAGGWLWHGLSTGTHYVVAATLKKIVVLAIQRSLGAYISDLQGESVEIIAAIQEGSLHMTDLKLRSEKLCELLGLPVRVLDGRVGLLNVYIPWLNLFQEPIRVELENVSVLVETLTADNFDKEVYEATVESRKQTQLRKIEELVQESQKDEATEKSEITLWDQLVAKAVECLEIKIVNLHCRYEHCSNKATSDQLDFALGVTIEQLVTKTTVNPVKQTPNLGKSLELKSVALYWNTNAQSFTNNVVEGMASYMPAGDTSRAVRADYVLQPVSISAQLALNLSPASDLTSPKVRVDVTLGEVKLSIKHAQLLCVSDLLSFVRLAQEKQAFWTHRPDQSVSDNPRAWFKYAITAVVEETIRPGSFSFSGLIDRKRLAEEYAVIYQLNLEGSTPGLVERLTEFEQQMDVSNIAHGRHKARMAVRKRKLLDAERASLQDSEGGYSRLAWVSSWWYGSKTGEQIDDDNVGESVFSKVARLSERNRTELQQVLGLVDGSVFSTDLPVEYVCEQFDFKLEHLQIRLVDHRRDVVVATMLGAGLSLWQRPAANAWGLKYRVQDVSVVGRTPRQGHSEPPILLAAKMSSRDEDGLFHIKFETNPHDCPADFSLEASLKPVQVFYEAATWKSLLQFFSMPDSRELNELTADLLLLLGARTSISFQYLIAQKKTLLLNVKLRSPIIIIPECGKLKGSSSVLVLDLGQLEVFSDPDRRDRSRRLAKDDKELREEDFFDYYHINLLDVQSFISNAGEKWNQANGQSAGLMPSFEVNLLFAMRLKGGPTSLPRMKINCKVADLCFVLSEDRTQRLFELYAGLPSPFPAVEASLATDDVLELAMSHGLPVALAVSRQQWTEASFTRVQRRLSQVIEVKRRSNAEQERPTTQCLSDDDLMNVVSNLVKKEKKAPSPYDESVSILATMTDGILSNPDEDQEDEEDQEDQDDSEGDDLFFDALEEPSADVLEKLREIVDISDLVVTCNVDEIEVLALQQTAGSSAETEYLRFKVDKFHCNFVNAHHTAFFYDQRQVISPYQKAHAHIRSVLLEDLTSDPGGPVKLLDSPASQTQLINLTFHQADELSPVLADFENALQAVRLTVADVAFTVHRESMSRLMNIGARLLVHWNSIPAAKTSPSRSTPSPSFNGNASAAASTRCTPEPKLSRSGTRIGAPAKSVMELQLNRMTMQLCGSSGYRLAHVSVDNLTTGVHWHACHVHLNCRLKALDITQCTTDTLHPQICSIMHTSEDLLDLKITIFNRSDLPPAHLDKGIDFDFNLKLRRLRVVYLHRFTSRLQNFLLDLSIMEQLAWVSEESSRRLAEELSKPRATRVTVHALLQAPILMFPRHSRSSEVLLIHLGNVKVHNAMCLTPVTLPSVGGGGVNATDGALHRPELMRSYGVDDSMSEEAADNIVILPVDSITIRLKDFVLLRMMNSALREDSPRHLLMEPINLRINVLRSLQRDSHLRPLFDASAHLDMVKVHLNRPDYLLLCGVWNENLAEQTPSQPRYEATPVARSAGRGGPDLYVLTEEPESSAPAEQRSVSAPQSPAAKALQSEEESMSLTTERLPPANSPTTEQAQQQQQQQHQQHQQQQQQQQQQPPWDMYRVTCAFDGIRVYLYIGEKALTAERCDVVDREEDRRIATADLRDGEFAVTVTSTDELSATFSLDDLRVLDNKTSSANSDIARIVDRNVSRVSDNIQASELCQMVTVTFNRPDVQYYTVKACLTSIHCKLSVQFIADVLSIFTSAEVPDSPLPTLSPPPVSGEAERDGGDRGSARVDLQPRPASASNWYEDLQMTYWCEVLIVDPDVWLVENPARLDSPVLSLQFEGEFLLIQKAECNKMAVLLSNLFIESFLCGHWVDTNVMVLRPCCIEFFSTPRTPERNSPDPAASSSWKSSTGDSAGIESSYDVIDAEVAGEGVDKLWVRVSQMSLNVSPALILTVQNILFNLWDYLWPTEVAEESVVESVVEEAMWQPKQMDMETWKMASTAGRSSPARILDFPRGEKLFVDVDGVDIKFDILHGDTTYVPVLAVGVHAHDIEIRDWSTQLSASMTVALEVTYFNRSSGVWEPLLEPLERSHSGLLRPWKLNVQYMQVVNQPVWQGEPKLCPSSTAAGGSGVHHLRGSASGSSGDEVDAFLPTGTLFPPLFLPSVEGHVYDGADRYAAATAAAVEGDLERRRSSASVYSEASSSVLSGGAGDGCDVVDAAGQVATCLVLSSSDLLSLTLSAMSLQLLTDVTEAYSAEVADHNATVRAQVSCLDVPVLVRNELGLNMDVVSYQELLTKPGEGIIKTQRLLQHKAIRLSWPSHQPALTSFLTSDVAAASAPEYVAPRRPPRLPSASAWQPSDDVDFDEADEHQEQQFWASSVNWLLESSNRVARVVRRLSLQVLSHRKDSGLFSKAQLQDKAADARQQFVDWPLLRAPDVVASSNDRELAAVTENAAGGSDDGSGEDEVDGDAWIPANPPASRKPRLRDAELGVSMVVDLDEDEPDGPALVASDFDSNTARLGTLWSLLSVDPGTEHGSPGGMTDDDNGEDGSDETDFPMYSMQKKQNLVPGGLHSPSVDAMVSPMDGLLQAGRLLASVVSSNTTTDSPVVNCQQPLAVEVDGFDVLRAVPLKRAGTYVMRLRPTTRHAWSKKTDCLSVACEVKSTQGQRTVTFHSVMEVKNFLSVELNVYCCPDLRSDIKREELEGALRSELQGLETICEKEGDRDLLLIGRVSPGETFYVPLFVVYEWQLFVSPADTLGFAPCLEGFSLSSLSPSQQSLVTCPLRGVSDEAAPSFCFRLAVELAEPMSCTSSTVSAILSQACSVPRHILNFHPPGVLYNLLPFPIRYLIEGLTVSWVEIEAGKMDCLYTNSLDMPQMLLIEIPMYRKRKWQGSVVVQRTPAPAIHPLNKSSRYQPIKFKPVDKSEKMYLAAELKVEASLHIRLFAPYWLVNKTTLPLAWKAAKPGANFLSDDVIIPQSGSRAESSSRASLEGDASDCDIAGSGVLGEPVLFSFGKSLHKGKVFVRADLDQARWSKKNFSLETVGSGDLAISKSVRQSFEFWLAIKPSSFGLTKIVTISPQLVVFNRTKVKLQWADEDVTAKNSTVAQEWHSVATGKSCPVWPLKNSSGRMVIKPANSYNSSLPFDYRSPLHYVLRMDSKELPAVCVEVRNCQNSLHIVISEYYQGAAPVRLENWCDSAIICFAQKGQSQQQFLWPGTSLLYTWPDPSGDRRLLWWCGGKQSDDEADGGAMTTYENVLHQDGSGAFTFFASRIDAPVSPTLLGMPTKKGQQISGMVQRGFWLSYLDGFQRVLLFTDKSAMREKLSQMVAVQMSTVQLYMALESVQISLVDDKPREVALLSLASGSSCWQVQRSESGHHRQVSPTTSTASSANSSGSGNGGWETLPVGHSCSLEAAYQSQLPSVTLPSTGSTAALSADLRDMSVSSPYSGRLRRYSAPAVWLQCAQSQQAFGIRLALHRLQMDDQLINAPAISPLSDSAHSGMQPFLETLISVQQASSHAIRHVKCAELQMRDVRMKLDLDFVVGVMFLLWPSIIGDEASVKALAFQEDQAALYRSVDQTSTDLFEQERALFSHLAIAPFKVQLNLSLRDPDGMAAMEKLQLNTLQNALLSIGGLLLDDKTVTLDMDSYHVENSRLGLAQANAEIVDHYTAQGLRQWYKFFFGPDVLSRPLHFIQGSVSSTLLHAHGHQGTSSSGKRHSVEALIRAMLNLDHGDPAAAVQGRRLTEQALVSDIQGPIGNVDAQSRAICSKVQAGECQLIDVLIDSFASLGGWSEKGHHSSAKHTLSEISDGLAATLCCYSGSVASVLEIATLYLLRAVDKGLLPNFALRLPRHVSLDGVLHVYLHHPSYGQSILQTLKRSGSLSSLSALDKHMYMTHGMTEDDGLVLFTQSFVLWLKKRPKRSEHFTSWHLADHSPLNQVVGEPFVSDSATVVCRVKTSIFHVTNVSIKAHTSHQAKIICSSISTALLYHQLAAVGST